MKSTRTFKANVRAIVHATLARGIELGKQYGDDPRSLPEQKQLVKTNTRSVVVLAQAYHSRKKQHERRVKYGSGTGR